MIDIHCHILPGIDDGPSILEISLAMASLAAEDGIRTIIATPHTDGIRVCRETVIEAVSGLNRELLLNRIDLKILPGHEVPYHLVSELGSTHTLAGSRYVLVEFPHTYLPRGAVNTFYTLLASGLIPIVAHPERNHDVLLNPALMEEIVASGAEVQLTASSITGEFGPDIQRCAHHLLRNGMVHYIASDSHSPTFREPVLMKAYRAVTRLVGEEQGRILFFDNPQRIVRAEAAKNLSRHR